MAGGPVGNVPPSLHTPSAHAIQQQQHQAYVAAQVAAANVQHQHAANHQTTPYVFINNVTANVNVHHGPVPNGSQQHPGGPKDTGNNGGVVTGTSQPVHMQPSQGMPVLSNHPVVPGQTSLQGSQHAGIHPPIHMPTGQMGPTTGMVPQSMSQPPPLHPNVVTSLAATGITPHPSGTALMHPIMTNPFQLPHQIPYNAIPTRSGTAPSQQQPSAHPNPATLMSMQQLQQAQMYGYPIFISPNGASQVPHYAASGALHGVPQQQIVHAAQAAMAQVQQAQVNVQQTPTHRQAIPPPPLQPHPVMLRNPLSPPAMQQATNSLNTPAGIAVTQSHQKIAATGFTNHQRTPIQPISSTTSSVGVSQNAPSQPLVPQHMLPSIPTHQLPHPSQPNQPPFFSSQQTANSPSSLPASAIATSGYPPGSFYLTQTPQKSILQGKQAVSAIQNFQSSNVTTSSVVSIDDQPDLIGDSDSHYVKNVTKEVTSDHDNRKEKSQSANEDELLTQQDEEEGLAFGTVDLKSLVVGGDVDAFEGEDIAGPQHSEIVDNISTQMPEQPSHFDQGEPSKYADDKHEVMSEEVFDEVSYATAEKTEGVERTEETGVAGAGDKTNLSFRETPDLPTKTKSWASLFKSESNIAVTGTVNVSTNNNSVYLSEGKLTARIQPYKENENENLDSSGLTAQSELNEVAFSGKDLEMGNYLKDYSLNHRAPSIKPRGLSNRSNWCFVNAILQALLACPPFYNLMKSLPKDLLIVPSSEQANPSVKILRAVYYFFSEFSPLDNFPKLNHRQNKNKKNEDLPLGKILEPTTIYNVLLNLNSDTFKVIEGRQEDAEEFLTFLLNGLNDEMMALLKLVEQQERDKSSERYG